MIGRSMRAGVLHDSRRTRRLFRTADRNGDGWIDLNEFLLVREKVARDAGGREKALILASPHIDTPPPVEGGGRHEKALILASPHIDTPPPVEEGGGHEKALILASPHIHTPPPVEEGGGHEKALTLGSPRIH